MPRRLVEPLERWLFDAALLALGLLLLWRLTAGLLLWGGLRQLWPWPGLIESQLPPLATAAALLLLARALVPRAWAAAAALLCGGGTLCLVLTCLPRHGWLIDWPPGRIGALWYWLSGSLLLLALLLTALCQLRWSAQLRGHGVVWTREWAREHSYAARSLARRALAYMGETDEE